ncbi:uncharacterized protein LOC131954059 [Physella acuta]|uniref:uncharacterized protein LOC131954059 n=1 Tax=Physella acuta TaxID=109671 RepID=UPI0027DB33AE|nr:uncharacterized protein LOC131954059 [Physella acuta]
MEDIVKNALYKRLREYPSIFHNKPAGTDTKRLRDIQLKVKADIDCDDDCMEELVSKYFFLTWVEFELGNFDESEELSNRALVLTKGNSLTALVHSAYVMMRNGDEIQAEKCLDKMDQMKNSDNWQSLISGADSELAYCLSRLGGPNNMKRTLEILTNLTDEFPDKVLWKYRLGLCHRRATRGRIFYTMKSQLTMDDHAVAATRLLFEVGKLSTDMKLRAHAYAQLAQISYFDERQLSREEHQRRYCNMSTQDFIQMALELGSNDVFTLLECGKILRYIDYERAIDLLEKSIAIKKHGVAYHQLGLCYVYKAENNITFSYFNTEKGIGSARRFDTKTDDVRKILEENQGRLPDEYLKTNPRYCNTSTKNYYRSNSEYTHRRNPDSQLRSQSYDSGCCSHKTDSKQARNSACSVQNFRLKKSCKQHRFIRCPMREKKLNIECEFVKKAMSCYKESIRLSFENNAQAIYDLGLLLKSCEQLDDAEKQFNKVTHLLDSMSLNFSNNEDEITSSHGHFILVVNAYEQAGLCLLKKAELEKSKCYGNEKQIEHLIDRGESKLVQTVSLSAMLVKLNTEMKEHSSHIWHSLRTLEFRYENEEKSPQSIKKFIELLGKTNHHKKVLNIIEKLKSYSDDELDDPAVVSAALESYLALKDYESALAFLNMVNMRPNVDIREVGQLVTSVQTCAIAKRLQKNESGAQLIMKTVFHQHTSGGSGGSGDSCGASADEVTNKSEVIPRDLDVIVIYDDSHDVEREESDITRTANQLCRVLEKTFGLAVSCNLKDCCSGGEKIHLQFEELLRAKVALILLGAEKPRDCSFQIFLDNIHYELSELAERGRDVPTVLVVFAAQGSELGVPSLSCCRQFCLDDILADINNYLQEKEKNSGQEEEDEVPILEDNSSEFSKGVNAVMTLFCLLIGKKWPL